MFKFPSFDNARTKKEFEGSLEHHEIERTPTEREAIGKFDIKKNLPAFDYFGEFDKTNFILNIQNHLSEAGDNEPESIKIISEHIAAIIEKTLLNFQKDAAWITLRITLPDDDFEIPRWHTDGSYFTTNEKTYKAITTLLGPTTRFGDASDPELFKKLLRENNPDDFTQEGAELRAQIAAIVSEKPRGTNEEITYFLVGDENAAIHSEPPLNSPRIFLSILPGTKNQIEEFKTHKDT